MEKMGWYPQSKWWLSTTLRPCWSEFPQQLQAAKWSHQLSQIKQKRENDITKKKQTKTAKQMDAKEESD